MLVPLLNINGRKPIINSGTLAKKEQIILTISNALGENIITTKAELDSGNDKINIDLEQLTKGIYFLTISTKELVLSKKIIKE